MYDEIVTNQIAKLPDFYQEFILSEMPGVMAETFVPTFDLDEAEEIVLGNAIVLLLIFLLDRTTFKDFVSQECQIPLVNLAGLDSAIITALPDDIKTFFLRTELELDNLPKQTTEDLASEISAVENTLRHIQINPEPTYTSTQAAILEEGRHTPSAS